MNLILEIVSGKGLISNQTLIELSTDSTVKITGNTIFENIDIKQLGIGGLSIEFEQLLRRAFASRSIDRDKFESLGIKHVKGVILYGPPGTGKTLIARKLGEMLGCIEPKVVNGPEILNKFIGESEKNIRDLFHDAELAQSRGDDSIHVIIFDEIDAICRVRGVSTATNSVNDSIVNQLLTKIDGVNSLNNILVVGLTNRIDLIDSALLRPGRLEIQIEISLPDKLARKEIYEIHTSKMRINGYLDEKIDTDYIIDKSKNFTGAEIEGLIKTAASYAISRVKNGDTELLIKFQDIQNAFQEVKPQFASSVLQNEWNELNFERSEMIDCIIKLINDNQFLRVLISESSRENRIKTCHYLAKSASAELIKTINPYDFVCLPDLSVSREIKKVFQEIARSPNGLIIIEEIDLLVRYFGVENENCSPIFSIDIMYTLMNMLLKIPLGNASLTVIATVSSKEASDKIIKSNIFDHYISSMEFSLKTGHLI